MTPRQLIGLGRTAAVLGFAVLALLVAAGVGYRVRGLQARAELAELQQQHATALADALRALRAQEARISTQHTEALNHADQQTRAAHADAQRLRTALRALSGAAERVQHPGAQAADACPASSATARAGAATAAASHLHADLLGRLGEAAGELAAYADAARIAAGTCAWYYDALTPPDKDPKP